MCCSQREGLQKGFQFFCFFTHFQSSFWTFFRGHSFTLTCESFKHRNNCRLWRKEATSKLVKIHNFLRLEKIRI